MMRKIKSSMFYILMPIYLVLLFGLYPIVVPQYLSQTTFLLGWLLVVAVTGGTIRLAFDFMEKKKTKP